VSLVDLLDRALDGHPDPAVSSLVTVAREVADALASQHLGSGERDRIYARALTLLEDALQQNRRGWQRVLRAARPLPVIVGGAAALTLGAAAIGWAVVHGRRPHGSVAVGLAARAAVPFTPP
jgi:hypothetical protein